MLLDKHGNIIDGRHRLAADEDWPKMKLEHVETEEDGLVARLISNALLLTLKELEGKERKSNEKRRQDGFAFHPA